MRKVVAAGMLGNGLEWYDYALYGHMAAILSTHFFPAVSDTAKLLATFGVFAVGFIFRPLGAILFGWIGDKYGRQTSLVIAILMMAIPTGAIGLLPTYEKIGILAPILLTIIRIFQGLSLGGEFSGSITYIVEHAPPNRRALAGCASIVSLILGFILGSFVSMLTVYFMGQEAFDDWGWRLPFLMGIAIGLIGFYIRHECDESPAYEEAKASGSLSSKPVRDAFAHHSGEMLQAFAIYMTVTMPFYLLSIYLITFMQKNLGLGTQDALTINTLALLAMLVSSILASLIADKIGRKKVLIVAAGLIFVLIYSLFGLMEAKTFTAILTAQLIFGFILGAYIGPVPALLVELFPTSVRFTGMALSYNVAAALFGGTAPMVCVWLIERTGSHMSIAWYVMLCCICSLIALFTYRDKWRESLS